VPWTFMILKGLFLAAMARWSWPGLVAAARCRRLQGCRECTWLVPCNGALQQLCTTLPRARARAACEGVGAAKCTTWVSRYPVSRGHRFR
jgi:hypothetical protein